MGRKTKKSDQCGAFDGPIPCHITEIISAEIFDHVIRELADNRVALQSFSTVCRNWLPASRYQLFSNFPVRMKDANADEILDSFSSADPTLTEYITSLHVSSRLFLRLSQIVVLPSLKFLHLGALSFEHYPQVLSCFETVYSGLTGLELSGVVHWSWDEKPPALGAILSLVASLRSLRELVLPNVSPDPSDCFYSADAPQGSATTPPPELASLNLPSSMRNKFVLEWLVLHRVQSVRRLTFIQSDSENEPLQEFLELAGEKLEHLSVLVPDVPSWPQYYTNPMPCEYSHYSPVWRLLLIITPRYQPSHMHQPPKFSDWPV